ncbi:ABC transporter ATP-binding protein [Arsenicicoccus sp. oral taxon 190]|uniref:ABC transporter ATP-binding protein n=1 Tax=Arsenicicoccus sp. oral taxon 190 TaxID=1658671 RepID=UPI000679F82C|nr:ABC transporter ATP-binding protein [Arsenicicoccus sp. oral taxon 190]AKT51115.1 peptide ABC transporter ATP-binding protein [Arsenicicoccus sp. oral taxon 190]
MRAAAPVTDQHPQAARPGAAAVRTHDLTKTYGSGDTRVVALDHVDVAFAEGEFTAIMGPSGSGKSTLMHCAAGLDDVTSGHVWVGDTDLTTLSDRQLTRLRREQVGFVFQAFNLLPTLTAQANILLPLQLAGRAPDQEWFDHVVRVLGLQDRLRHKPTELSGGQQQRVAVARALVMRPRVIFADEPTGALDSVTGHELLDFLRRSVRELGQTVVMVTHDPHAATYADRVLLLADGRLAGELREPGADDVLRALRGLGA